MTATKKAAAVLLMLAALANAEWITPKGKSYHVRRDCIALRTTATPETITRAEAERRGLKLCGICSRRKKGAAK